MDRKLILFVTIILACFLFSQRCTAQINYAEIPIKEEFDAYDSILKQVNYFPCSISPNNKQDNYMDGSAQSSDTTQYSHTTLYLELAGNAGWYSFNLDQIIWAKNKANISARLGVSYYPPPLAYNHYFSFPVEVNFFYGIKNHFEIAIGALPVIRLHNSPISQLYDSYCYSSARIGYRFQRKRGGWFWRAGIIVAITTPKYLKGNGGNIWTVGLGIGYSLKR